MKTIFWRITASSMLIVLVILIIANPAFAQDNTTNATPNDQYSQQVEKQIYYSDQQKHSNQQKQQINHQKQYNKQQKQSGDQQKNIEAQRIAYITQRLELTPDEAKAFWPVYNEYDAKRHELKKSFRESGNGKNVDYDKLTEKEANQILDNQIIEAQRFLDLRKEYHVKFKAVLPSVKVLKLYDSERSFQKMLMDKMHDQHTKAPADKK